MSVTPVALAAKHCSAESAETFLQTGEDADLFKTRPASSFHQHRASGSWTGCPCHCCHPHPGAGCHCARHCPSTEPRSDAPAQAAPQIPALGSPSCSRRGSGHSTQRAYSTASPAAQSDLETARTALPLQERGREAALCFGRDQRALPRGWSSHPDLKVTQRQRPEAKLQPVGAKTMPVLVPQEGLSPSGTAWLAAVLSSCPVLSPRSAPCPILAATTP